MKFNKWSKNIFFNSNEISFIIWSYHRVNLSFKTDAMCKVVASFSFIRCKCFKTFNEWFLLPVAFFSLLLCFSTGLQDNGPWLRAERKHKKTGSPTGPAASHSPHRDGDLKGDFKLSFFSSKIFFVLQSLKMQFGRCPREDSVGCNGTPCVLGVVVNGFATNLLSPVESRPPQCIPRKRGTRMTTTWQRLTEGSVLTHHVHRLSELVPAIAGPEFAELRVTWAGLSTAR